MKRLFLDTSAYSSYKQGHSEIVEAIGAANQIFLNAIVIGELLAGFDRGRYKKVNRKELDDFLCYPSVTVLPLTEETSEKYSLIYCDLKRAGRPIPTNDLWIAASVMEEGAALATADKHFLHVRQLQTLFLDNPVK